MDDEEIRKRVCVKCDFYKEGDTLQCHAFKVNKTSCDAPTPKRLRPQSPRITFSL
jgi:hypothetical protein